MPDEKTTNHAIWVRPDDKAAFEKLRQRDGFSAPQWYVFREILQAFLIHRGSDVKTEPKRDQ